MLSLSSFLSTTGSDKRQRAHPTAAPSSFIHPFGMTISCKMSRSTAVVCLILTTTLHVCIANNFSGYATSNCPFIDSKRIINDDTFDDLCPGGNKSIKDYFLYGFLASFNSEYNGVGKSIAGAIPMAVEQVNK